MKTWGAILVLLLVLVVIPIRVWAHYGTMETVQGLVIQDKERVTTGTGKDMESTYLIFTDQETFKDVDSWLSLKFNSSDVYGNIQRGQTCSFRVTGFRIPFLSHYRNILSADCQ